MAEQASSDSAAASAAAAQEAEAEKAARLAAAEASMTQMLKKVNQETAEVEKAMQDLKRAQLEDNQGGTGDFLLQLRQGGIPKQAALVGTVLFGVRALTDAVTGNLVAAGIQIVLALACAAALFLL